MHLVQAYTNIFINVLRFKRCIPVWVMDISYKHYYVESGVHIPAEEQKTFNSSASDEDFFKWLRSRGISDNDCKIHSGKLM